MGRGLLFKDGFWDGIFTWFTLLTIIGLSLLILGLIVSMVEDQREMRNYHCVKTEQTREQEQVGTVIVGKAIMPYKRKVTESLYTCDDKSRWR